jgi:hypothetical protein
MKLRNKWMMGLLILGATAIVGVSATAVYAQTATPDQTPLASEQRLCRGEDNSALLAEALGISEEELQAAKAEVQNRLLAEAVAAGEITQEEADLMAARLALQEYLRDRMQTAYEQAVAQAVADGVITQAQADQILSEEGAGFFGPRMGGGRPFGRHGHGPDGGFFGRPGRGQAPNDAPLPPENATPESSNAPVIPSNDISL